MSHKGTKERLILSAVGYSRGWLEHSYEHSRSSCMASRQRACCRTHSHQGIQTVRKRVGKQALRDHRKYLRRMGVCVNIDHVCTTSCQCGSKIWRNNFLLLLL